MTLKVLILGRFDLFDRRGGDTVQIENTVSELQKLGVDVKVKNNLNFEPKDFDLVHIFQLDWIPETYLYAKKVHDSGVPMILSPIHHSIQEVKKYDDEYVFDFRRISRLFSSDQFVRDTFKNVYRSFLDYRKIKPTLYTIAKGFKNTQKLTLSWSDLVLVQTEKEAEDLQKTFNLAIKWVKVPNGVGDAYLNCSNLKNPLSFSNYIISVGRIEPRKNQINIIKAVDRFRNENNLKTKMVFIGTMGNVKHIEYTKLFLEEMKKHLWVTHLEKIPYNEMPSYYKYAKVCVSASWFETTGLTSLEALFCGTNAVASGGRALECLGSYATYCVPDVIATITEAIKKEYFAPRPEIDEEMKLEYTWKNAATKTFQCYQEVLSRK